jgi:molybdopterin synthase catalytic subunit
MSENIHVRVLFFANLKDIAKQPAIDLNVPKGISLGTIRNEVIQRFPEIKEVIEKAVISCNNQFAFPEDIVPDGAEVAFFPPVSGGVEPITICRVVTGELDLNALTVEITQISTGAVVSFIGVVRGETTHKQAHTTTRLEYEAYIPMAEAKMHQIAGEIRSRWPQIESISMVQRIGVLEPKTPTVFIACAAGHRDQGAFEAARYGIDRLKEIVPVWKKEIGPNGEEWVEGEYQPERGD